METCFDGSPSVNGGPSIAEGSGRRSASRFRDEYFACRGRVRVSGGLVARLFPVNPAKSIAPDERPSLAELVSKTSDGRETCARRHAGVKTRRIMSYFQRGVELHNPHSSSFCLLTRSGSAFVSPPFRHPAQPDCLERLDLAGRSTEHRLRGYATGRRGN